uniref:2'-phosphotransferase n=1 Tax=Alexandrium monilatum TaxID=311494 RepID=A0A7S4S1B9_9DINO
MYRVSLSDSEDSGDTVLPHGYFKPFGPDRVRTSPSQRDKLKRKLERQLEDRLAVRHKDRQDLLKLVELVFVGLERCLNAEELEADLRPYLEDSGPFVEWVQRYLEGLGEDQESPSEGPGEDRELDVATAPAAAEPSAASTPAPSGSVSPVLASPAPAEPPVAVPMPPPAPASPPRAEACCSRGVPVACPTPAKAMPRRKPSRPPSAAPAAPGRPDEVREAPPSPRRSAPPADDPRDHALGQDAQARCEVPVVTISDEEEAPCSSPRDAPVAVPGSGAANSSSSSRPSRRAAGSVGAVGRCLTPRRAVTPPRRAITPPKAPPQPPPSAAPPGHAAGLPPPPLLGFGGQGPHGRVRRGRSWSPGAEEVWSETGSEDRANVRSSWGGRSRSRDEGVAERGGGPRLPDRLAKLSRAMSGILRHRAHEEGVRLSSDGFARLSEVLRILHGRYSVAEALATVRQSVYRDGSPRFELDKLGKKDRDPLIRALGGHTIPDIGVDVQAPRSAGQKRKREGPRKREGLHGALSRAMSKVLRYEAFEEGWAATADVIRKMRKFSPRQEDLERVVQTSFHSDGTPRFEMKQLASQPWVRAVRKRSMRGEECFD